MASFAQPLAGSSPAPTLLLREGGNRSRIAERVLVTTIIAVAVFLAYRSGLRAPFILDDEGSIVANASVRSLWPLRVPLSPPRDGGLTVEGRPILNLSLALDYAFGGAEPRHFRLTNLAIHATAALLLFGLARRTFLLGSEAAPVALRSEARPSRVHLTASIGAGIVALLWALHPLQTESVTYVIQRAESLCGMFYLLTLYAFLRSAEPAETIRPWRRIWAFIAVASCLCGMGTKEVMVSAPLLVLLFDRTFLAGSFARAWRIRRGFYVSLAATWLFLGGLLVANAARGGSAGFGSGISPWHYALTQCSAIALYLELTLWPHPLVFDYGTPLITHAREAVASIGATLGLVVLSVFSLWRYPRLGFLGAWFFALLAPSSSFIPVATQTIAEHRMYLPLAAAIVALGWVAYRLLGRGAFFLGVAAIVSAGSVSAQRNALYCDPLAVWADVVMHRPENTRARNNLALVLRARHRPAESLAQLDAALAREPGNIAIRNNRANVLADLARHDEALREIDAVLQAAPGLAEAYDTKADVLRGMNRSREADAHYAHALFLKPSLTRPAPP